MKLTLKNSKKEFIKEATYLLIIGDAACVREDIGLFNDHGINWSEWDVMSVGRSVQIVDYVQHWANVDGAEAKWWAEHLPANNRSELPYRHTIGEYPWFDMDWEPEGLLWDPSEVLWHGSSALFGVYVGLALGYDKITLAGCPLDRNGHFYDLDHTVRWTGETYQAWLDFARDPRSSRVESLSGYTKQILGSR